MQTKPVLGPRSRVASAAVKAKGDELPGMRATGPKYPPRRLINRMNMKIEPISNSKGDHDNSESLDSKQEKIRTNQFSNDPPKVVIRKLPFPVLRYSSKNDTSSVMNLSSNDTAEAKDSESISSGDRIVKPAEVQTPTSSSEDTKAAEEETHVEKISTPQGRLPAVNVKKTIQRGRIPQAAVAGRGKQSNTSNVAESLAYTRDINQEVKDKSHLDQEINEMVSVVEDSSDRDMTTLPGESTTRPKLRVTPWRPANQRSQNRQRLSNKINSAIRTNVTEPPVDTLAVTSLQLDEGHTTKGISTLEQAMFQEDSSRMSNLRDQRAAFKPPEHMEGGFVPMLNPERLRRVTPESEEPTKFKLSVPTKIAPGVLRKPHQSEKEQRQTRRPLPVPPSRSPEVPRRHPEISRPQRPSLPPSMSNQNSQPSQESAAPQRPSLALSTSNQNPKTPQQSSAPQRLKLPISTSNQIPQTSQKPLTHQRPTLPLSAPNHVPQAPQKTSTAHRPTLPFSVSNQNLPRPQQQSTPQRLSLPLSMSIQIPQSPHELSTAKRPRLPSSVSNQNPQILKQSSTPQRLALPLSASNPIPQATSAAHRPTLPFSMFNQNSQIHQVSSQSPTSPLFATNQNPQTLQVARHPEADTRAVQQPIIRQPETVRNQFSHHTPHHSAHTGVDVSGNSLHGARGHPGNSHSSLNNGSPQLNPTFQQTQHNVDVIQKQVIPHNTIHASTQPGFIHSNTGHTNHFNNPPFHQQNPVFPQGVPNTHTSQSGQHFAELQFTSQHRPMQPINTLPGRNEIRHISTQGFPQPERRFPQNVHHTGTADQQLAGADFTVHNNPQANHLANGQLTFSHFNDVNVQNRFQQPQQSHTITHSQAQTMTRNEKPTLDELAAYFPEVFYQQLPHSRSSTTTGDEEVSVRHQAVPVNQITQAFGSNGLRLQDVSSNSQVSQRTSKHKSKTQTTTDDLHQQLKAQQFIRGLLEQQQKQLARSTPSPLFTTSDSETKPSVGVRSQQMQMRLPSDINSSEYQQQLQLYHKQQLAYLQHLRQMLASKNADGDTT